MAPSSQSVGGCHLPRGRASPRPGGRDKARSASVDWRLWGGILALGALLILWKGRGDTFFWDEWGWIEFRRNGLHAALSAYNGHWELVPTLTYQVLLRAVGLTHYWVFRLLAVAGHLVCATVLFMYARRRIGLFAWSVALPFVFLGSGWEFILWGVNFGFTASLAAGIAALMALDADDRRADCLACALLVLGLAMTEFAVLFALGIVAELVARERRLARLWVPAVPLLAYAAWWLTEYHGAGSHATLGEVVRFVPNLAASTAGALFGLSGHFDVGRALLVLCAGLFAWRVIRASALSPRLVGLVVMLAAFWLLVAVERAQYGQPYLSRYLYTGIVFGGLIGVESLRGVRPTASATAAAVLLCLLALVGNLQAFSGGERYLHGSRVVAGELTALARVQRIVPDNFVLDERYAPQVIAGPYFRAIHALHSNPADTPSELARSSELVRAAAESVLLRARGLAVPYRETFRRPTPHGSP